MNQSQSLSRQEVGWRGPQEAAKTPRPRSQERIASKTVADKKSAGGVTIPARPQEVVALKSMRKPSTLRPYRREIINLHKDEKTLDQISKYLSQEYCIDASTDDIRHIVSPEKIPRIHESEAQ